MPDSIMSFLLGGLGGISSTVFQYAFRRYAETQEQRREIVETRLLQLQNSVESLYYRANNLLDWAGRSTMSDDYFHKTSAFSFATVLAHESLLVSTGIYAKLNNDSELKHQIKGSLHQLNSAMDTGGFHHYYRVQLADMALDRDRVIGYSEFLDRWEMDRYRQPLDSLKRALPNLAQDRLERIRSLSGELVQILCRKTGVPSALELSSGWSTRRPARSQATPSARVP